MTDSEPRIRAEIRARAPCPVCQQPAFLDPPCTITDMRTGVTRVEQNINCTKCNTAHHWRPGMTRNQQAALKEKQANGATLCLCGCGQFCRPGRPYLKGHKLNQASPAPAAIADPAPEVQQDPHQQESQEKSQEEEPMVATPTIWCPCKCGKPVPPGRKFAARGCAGRAKRGVPIAPAVLARRSETIRKAKKKPEEFISPGQVRLCASRLVKVTNEENALQKLANLSEVPDAGMLATAEPTLTSAGGILTYGSEVQEQAKEVLEALETYWAERRRAPTPDVYITVAELARAHDAKTLRAAANLRDMVGAQ